MLMPKNSLCDRDFLVVVDNTKFIGHPTSIPAHAQQRTPPAAGECMMTRCYGCDVRVVVATSEQADNDNETDVVRCESVRSLRDRVWQTDSSSEDERADQVSSPRSANNRCEWCVRVRCVCERARRDSNEASRSASPPLAGLSNKRVRQTSFGASVSATSTPSTTPTAATSGAQADAVRRVEVTKFSVVFGVASAEVQRCAAMSDV
jgi:hypothetical protein